MIYLYHISFYKYVGIFTYLRCWGYNDNEGIHIDNHFKINPLQILSIIPGGNNNCLGVCVAERIADYCEAVLNDANLCKPGLRCCVSKDAYSGTLPPNLVIMERNGTKPNSGSQSSSTTPYVSSTSAVTQTTTSRPQQPAGSKPCHGENVSERLQLVKFEIFKGA